MTKKWETDEEMNYHYHVDNFKIKSIQSHKNYQVSTKRIEKNSFITP